MSGILVSGDGAGHVPEDAEGKSKRMEMERQHCWVHGMVASPSR